MSADHGTRSRYTAGCRCGLCREANTAYGRCQQARRQEGHTPRVLVPAEPVRAHLKALSSAGVGYRAVGDACGLQSDIPAKILSGRRSRCTETTATAILSVTADALADGAWVSPKATRARLAELREEGYTLVQIAGMLGRRSLRVARQGRVHVRAITHVRVERLWRRITEVGL